MNMIKLGTVSALLISTMVLGGEIFAAEVSLNSNAVVEFEENTDQTNPVNPLDPDKPVLPIDTIDPDGEITEGTAGPLSIDFISSLNFGKQKISSVDQTYFAKPQLVIDIDGNNDEEVPLIDIDGNNEEEVPLFAQITDNRGTLGGWSLSVKQNGQFNNGDATHGELVGAKIEFLNGEVASSSVTMPSFVNSPIDVTADGEGASTVVMAASEGEGSGTFVYRLGNESSLEESVKLSVPGSTVKMKDAMYRTTLTWTLNDVPNLNSFEEELVIPIY